MKSARTPKTPLLIVDDDKAVLRLLARVAERAGFEVDTAKDGVQAMEMLGKKQYDIAIIDLMMPRMSGYELVQKISTLNPRPVVLVATALMNGDVATLDDSMVRRVIKKPFDINAVAAALVETAKDIAEKRGATPPTGVTVIADKATVLASEVKVVAPQEVKVVGATPAESPAIAPPAEEKPAEKDEPPLPPPEKTQ